MISNIYRINKTLNFSWWKTMYLNAFKIDFWIVMLIFTCNYFVNKWKFEVSSEQISNTWENDVIEWMDFIERWIHLTLCLKVCRKCIIKYRIISFNFNIKLFWEKVSTKKNYDSLDVENRTNFSRLFDFLFVATKIRYFAGKKNIFDITKIDVWLMVR